MVNKEIFQCTVILVFLPSLILACSPKSSSDVNENDDAINMTDINENDGAKIMTDINERDDAKNMTAINEKDDAINMSYINERGWRGRTKLWDAANDGDLHECERLVAAGANVNIADDHGDTPLMIASSHGHLSIVKLLYDHEADVTAVALIRAARNGHLDIVKYLVENGSDINVKDNYGVTAMMYAAWYDHLEIVKYLVENGADINVKD